MSLLKLLIIYSLSEEKDCSNIADTAQKLITLSEFMPKLRNGGSRRTYEIGNKNPDCNDSEHVNDTVAETGRRYTTNNALELGSSIASWNPGSIGNKPDAD